MKNKVSFIIVVWWILILGFLGGYVLLFAPKEAVASEKENRMLQAFPEFSFEAMADGTFTSELETYFTDKILLRDALTTASKSFMNMFSILDSDDSLTEEKDDEDFGLAEEGAQHDGQGEDTSSDDETQVDQIRNDSFFNVYEPYADRDYINDPSVWEGNRYFDKYESESEYEYEHMMYITVGHKGNTEKTKTRDHNEADKSIAALNALAEVVPEDGKLYVVPVYISKTMNYVQNRMKALGKEARIDSQLEHYLRDNVADNVRVYSTIDILEDHFYEKEVLFYVTDHHWTQYGALTVANTVINDMGYVATEYVDYKKTFHRDAFYGSFSREDNVEEYDDIEFLNELKPTDMYFINRNGSLTDVEYIEEWAPEYASLLGGRVKPWGIVKTGSNTGRKALMFGDSYLLAFAVAFNEIYDEIYIIDNREYYKSFGGPISEIIENYGIDDVFVVYMGMYFFDETLQENLPNALY